MDFLCAQGLYAVLSELRSWLRQEDIICFWHKSGKNMLKSMYHLTFGQTVSQRIVILGRYVFLYLKERGRRSGSAYAICDDFGMQAPGPKHQSEHDAAAIRQALLAIQYPAALLYGPPPDEGGKKRRRSRSRQMTPPISGRRRAACSTRRGVPISQPEPICRDTPP